MRQETKKNWTFGLPYHQTPISNNEILTSILEEAFVFASHSKTERAFTVVKTPSFVFDHQCLDETTIATLVKEKKEVLGTICLACGQMFRLTFDINPEIIDKIEQQSRFEDSFPKKQAASL